MGEVKDLSQYHQLLSAFFKQPQSSREWDQYQLTAAQVEFFNENAGRMAGG